MPPTSKRARPDPPEGESPRYVECPICSASVPRVHINSHLDQHMLSPQLEQPSTSSVAGAEDELTAVPPSAPTVPSRVATPAAPKVASVAWPAGFLAAASPLARAFGISVTTPVSSAAAASTVASDRSVGFASPGAQAPAVPTTASSSYMPRFNGRSEDGTYPGGGCFPDGGMATCDPRRLNAWHPRLRVSSASSTPSYLRLLDLGDALCAALRLALLQRGALSADEVRLAVGFVALPPLGRALCAAALEEPGEWVRLEALPRSDETQHGGRMSPDLFLGLAAHDPMESDGGDAFAISSAGLAVSLSGAVASSAQGPQSDEPPSDEPGTARSVWSRVASAVGSHLLEELCPKRVLSAARSSRAPLVGPFARMTPSPKTTPFGAKTTTFGLRNASASAASPRTPPLQRSGLDAPRSGLDELHRPLTKLTLRELREVSIRYGATPAPRPQKGTAAAHADDLATQLLHLLSNRRSPDLSPLSEALGPCVRFPPKLLPTLRRLAMAGLAGAGYGPQPAHCLLRAYCDFPAGIGAGAHTAAEGADDAPDAALRAALLHTEACLGLADATDAIAAAAAAAAAATPQPRATPPQPSGAPSASADVLALLDQLRSLLRDPKTSGGSALLTLQRVAGSALAHCVLLACAQLRRLQRRAEAAALLAEAIATEGLPHSFRAPALVQLAQQLQSDGHKQHALQLCEAAHAAGGALSEAVLSELLGSLLPTATGIQAGGSDGGAGASATAAIDLSDEASGDTNGGSDGGDASHDAEEPAGGGGGSGEAASEESAGGASECGSLGGGSSVGGSLDGGVVLGESHLLSIRKSLVKLAVPPRRWKKPRLDEPPSAPEVTVWARQLAPEPNGVGNGTRRGRWVLAGGGGGGSTGSGSVGSGDGGGGVSSLQWEEAATAPDATPTSFTPAMPETTASVEALAAHHYTTCHGWALGLHSENSIPLALFALLLWDALFAPLPGTLVSPAQDAPADLHDARSFYRRRAGIIEPLLARVRAGEAPPMLRAAHAAHCGTPVISFTWGRYEPEFLCHLAEALGGGAVAAMCAALAADYPCWSHGFPDLLLFSPPTGAPHAAEAHGAAAAAEPSGGATTAPPVQTRGPLVKIVEVKGPGDRLSEAQIAWIGVLLAHGVVVEVCRVKAET